MPQKKPTVYEFIPKLGQLRDDVLFGDVWEHPDLSKRDRSLITVAMLAALYRTDEMRGHMQRALDNGVTETELKGLITHVAFYAGWPCAVNAGRIADRCLRTEIALGSNAASLTLALIRREYGSAAGYLEARGADSSLPRRLEEALLV